MDLDVELEGFSGPLDLLCHLVETGEISASSISVSELIRVYSDFLIRNDRATINEMAAFFSLTARLLLGKLKSLLPSLPGSGQEVEETEPEGDLFVHALNRYRPFRSAAAQLAALMKDRARCFTRDGTEEGPPWFDLGDLYSLAVVWWDMVRTRKDRNPVTRATFEEDWNGIPVATPEEEQVERRMEEIDAMMSREGSLSLSDIIGRRTTRQVLVVTFLALLEMARLGKVRIIQEGLFGDVRLCC